MRYKKRKKYKITVTVDWLDFSDFNETNKWSKTKLKEVFAENADYLVDELSRYSTELIASCLENEK